MLRNDLLHGRDLVLQLLLGRLLCAQVEGGVDAQARRVELAADFVLQSAADPLAEVAGAYAFLPDPSLLGELDRCLARLVPFRGGDHSRALHAPEHEIATLTRAVDVAARVDVGGRLGKPRDERGLRQVEVGG